MPRNKPSARIYIPLKLPLTVCAGCGTKLGPTDPRLKLTRNDVYVKQRASLCLPCLRDAIDEWSMNKKEWAILAQNYIVTHPHPDPEDQLRELARLRVEDPVTASLLEALE
jgi:recombinational DNA repair protein (RecF pathway)